MFPGERRDVVGALLASKEREAKERHSRIEEDRERKGMSVEEQRKGTRNHLLPSGGVGKEETMKSKKVKKEYLGIPPIIATLIVCLVPLVLADTTKTLRDVRRLKTIQDLPETVNTPNVSGKVPDSQSLGVVSSKNVSLPSAARDPAVLRLQQQINEILMLNESIKEQFKAQSAEIQRISKIARLHKKILEDLTVPPNKERELKLSDAEEILRQEKLRLIQKETERNKAFLDNLQHAEETPGQGTPSRDES